MDPAFFVVWVLTRGLHQDPNGYGVPIAVYTEMEDCQKESWVKAQNTPADPVAGGLIFWCTPVNLAVPRTTRYFSDPTNVPGQK